MAPTGALLVTSIFLGGSGSLSLLEGPARVAQHGTPAGVGLPFWGNNTHHVVSFQCLLVPGTGGKRKQFPSFTDSARSCALSDAQRQQRQCRAEASAGILNARVSALMPAQLIGST